MSDVIRHRGPDDHGEFVDASRGIALAFRRLAIVDLSELGHQPMTSQGRRYVMIFNGEIYNFVEIRTELRSRGHKFKGGSDTEVALAAFEEWGIEESLRRFNGMFAIAVWDNEHDELTLARDRMGKKPLFVYRDQQTVIFASELKSLLSDPTFDRSLDPAAVVAYLRFMYVPAPACIFRKTEKLLPGHLITFSRDTSMTAQSRAYWSLSERSQSLGEESSAVRNIDEAVELMHELLRDSVRIRMQADVPLGALLSGGIDSSLVVGVMAELATQPVRTFTIGFNVPEYDEAQHARRVANHLGTNHTELYLDGSAALALVPRLPDIFDEPLSDPSQIPTFLVCQLARQHVTVALTGDGGDELFAGYHRYLQGEGMIRRLSKVSPPLRHLSAAVLDAVPEWFWRTTARIAPRHAPRLLSEKVHKTARLLRQNGSEEMYRSLLSVWADPHSFMAAGAPAVHNGRARTWRESSLLRSMMLTDQLAYLPDDLLAKLDRASMAVSLEARAPLLDYRIVETSWRLSRDMLINKGLGKQILRSLLYRYVPREMIERPKMGFSVPVADWLGGPLRGMASDLLSRESIAMFGVLNPVEVESSWNRFLRGERGDALGIWTLVMFQAWCFRWMRSSRPGAVGTIAA